MGEPSVPPAEAPTDTFFAPNPTPAVRTDYPLFPVSGHLNLRAVRGRANASPQPLLLARAPV